MVFVCAVLLSASLLLGGGTHAGFVSDAVLQLVSVPLLLVVMVSWRRLPVSSTFLRASLFMCAALVAVPLLQLVPLPTSLVGLLAPNRTARDIQDLLGLAPAWQTLSVAPDATALAALSLLPGVTLFLGVLMLTATERRFLVYGFIVWVFGSVLLGMLQLAQGPNSRLRFFDYTNYDDAVGFFANRNHFAALIYAALPLLAASAAQFLFVTGKRQPRARKDGSFPFAGRVALVGLGLLVLMAAEAMARSRAGILITVLALPVLAVLLLPHRKLLAGSGVKRGLIAASVLGALFIFEFAAFRASERFTGDIRTDGRIIYARNTIAAAKAFMPMGSGVNTFTVVYPQFSGVHDESVGYQANRAHNDLLEVWLEAGVVAIAVGAAFAAWLTLGLIGAWRRFAGSPFGSQERADAGFAIAGGSIVVMLVLHSALDYPLRTGALMAVFSVAAALLAMGNQSRLETRQERMRRRSSGRPRAAAGDPG